MSIGDFPEIMSQQILVGIISVGRLGVLVVLHRRLPLTASRGAKVRCLMGDELRQKMHQNIGGKSICELLNILEQAEKHSARILSFRLCNTIWDFTL